MSGPKINIRERALIKDNIDLPAQDIATILLEETGVVVSTTAINSHIRKIRESETEQSALVCATIDKNINEFIKNKTIEYMNILDQNIQNINSLLSSKPESGEPNSLLHDQYIRYSKLLGDQILAMRKLAPPSPSLDNNNEKGKVTVAVTTTLDELFEKYHGAETVVSAKKNNKEVIKNESQDVEFNLIDDSSEPVSTP